VNFNRFGYIARLRHEFTYLLKTKKIGVIDRVKHEFNALLKYFVMFFPADYIGRVLRNIYWGRRFNMGANPTIHYGANIVGEGQIEIGCDFILQVYSEINAGPDGISKIFIGDNVAIGRGSFILNANHRFDSIEIPMMFQGHESGKIDYKGNKFGLVIENDVLIGANVVVLTGTHIGTGSVIGPNAVVSQIIPPFSIVVGNPGRVIGTRIKNTNIS
jgi:acetyltransferase-like isoleucine patch superfamily enzyme